MSYSNTTKYADTALLRQIAEDSTSQGFNRQMNLDWIDENVDPTGKHVITLLMIHEHINGAEADPHMRCSIFIKENGMEPPAEVIADISMEMFESLPTVTVTKNDDGETEITWNDKEAE